MLNMAYTNKQRLLFSLALVCCVGWINSQILPDAFCQNAVDRFIERGCLEDGGEEVFACRRLAFCLLFAPAGIRFCSQRPCVGYGQDDPRTVCRSSALCLTALRDSNGICPGSDVCCRMILPSQAEGEIPDETATDPQIE